MGLISYIICERELPFPKEVDEIESPPDWSEFEFQTPSFHTVEDLYSEVLFFDKYEISEDGQLYKNIIERELLRDGHGVLDAKETPRGIERQEYTGEVVIFGTHLDDKYDFLLEFKTLFWKGDLKEIECTEFKKIDNTERIKKAREIRDKLIEEVEKEKSLINKTERVYNYLVVCFFSLIRYFLSLVIKLVWTLQRLLVR